MYHNVDDFGWIKAVKSPNWSVLRPHLNPPAVTAARALRDDEIWSVNPVILYRSYGWRAGDKRLLLLAHMCRLNAASSICVMRNVWM